MKQLLLLFLLFLSAGCSHLRQESGLRTYVQGLFYEKEDNKEQAAESYRETIRIDGESAYLYIKLGNLRLKEKKSDEAKRCFFRALRLNPESDEALFSLGIAYLLEENSRLAASYIEKGLALNPENHSMRMVLCDTLVALNELEKAAVQYEILLETFPGNYLLHFNYGNLLERMHRYEKAEQAYLDSINLAGRFWKGTAALALLYNKRGRNSEASEYFRKAVEMNPKDSVSYSFLIFSYYGAKDTGKAKELLKEAMGRGIQNTEFYNLLGVIYLEEGDYRSAEDAFSRSIEYRDTSSARFYLGILYDKEEKPEKMEKEMKRAVEIDPGNALALNYLGYSYLLQDSNLEDAYRMIRRACEIDPGNGAFLDSLGWAYYKRGNYRKARKYLEKAASLEQDAEIYEHLGDLYLQIKDYIKSLHWFIKSYEINSNEELLEKIEEVKKLIRNGIT